MAESLRRIVTFDHVGPILHDASGNAMQGHILNAPGNRVITTLRLQALEKAKGQVGGPNGAAARLGLNGTTL